jgi:plasmid stability protein
MSESLKQRLRIQAAKHNRSIETEARLIIEKSVSDPEALAERKKGLGTALSELFAGCGEIETPKRSEPPREIAL